MNIGFLSRIRSRIMLLSLLPTTILVVLVTQYFAMSRINDLELSFTQRGNAIAQNLAASSVYGLFTGNTERLRLASEELLKRSDALSITITDNDGGVVLELPEGGLTSLQVSNPDLASYFAPVHAPALQDSVQDFPEAPSALGGLEDPPEARQIGTVTVHLYQKEFSDRQRVIIGQAVLVTLLGLGVTSLLALGFSRKLTLPLEDLSAAARNISNGNFSVHVPEVSSGELGLLEKGFNTMVQEVASAHGKLEQRVEIATSELLETMDHLEIKNIQLELSRKQEREANLAQQLFLTSVSHEIRTPLNAVVNFLRLLRDTPLNARQEEYAMLSEDSARSLLHIINDLLSFSRLQRGDLVLEQGEFDIRTLLGNTLSLLAPDAHRKGLELVLLVYDDVPTILRGDGQRIQQIVTNLVSNAIKFTAQGQVAVRVQLDDRLNDQCTLLIQVADTGIGVPAQQAEEIFEPFKQIRSSDHNTFGGTGLGVEHFTPLCPGHGR